MSLAREAARQQTTITDIVIDDEDRARNRGLPRVDDRLRRPDERMLASRVACPRGIPGREIDYSVDAREKLRGFGQQMLNVFPQHRATTSIDVLKQHLAIAADPVQRVAQVVAQTITGEGGPLRVQDGPDEPLQVDGGRGEAINVRKRLAKLEAPRVLG